MKKNRYEIIWPFYKDYKFLNKSINDINAQTFLPFKIIFIDDGNQDPKLRTNIRNKLNKKIILDFVCNNENLGPEKSLEIAFKKINSKFFYIKATDDRIYKNFFKENIKILVENIHSPFVFSNIIIKNLINKHKYLIKFSFLRNGYYNKNYVKNIFREHQFKIYHNTVVINSKIFLKDNIFKRKYGYRCDMLNLQYLASKYGFTYLNKNLSEFIVRKNQWGKIRSDAYLINEMKNLKKNKKSFYNFFINCNLHYDLSVFSIPKLIFLGFKEIITFKWFFRSIKFLVWKKIRFLINPKLLNFLFKVFN